MLAWQGLFSYEAGCVFILTNFNEGSAFFLSLFPLSPRRTETPFPQAGLLQSLILPPSAAGRGEEAIPGSSLLRAPSRGLQSLVYPSPRQGSPLIPDLATAVEAQICILTFARPVCILMTGVRPVGTGGEHWRQAGQTYR